MEQDHREITACTMGSVHGRGPVFYASLPCADDILNRCGADGAGNKHRLVSTLWELLIAMEIPLWKRCQSPNKADFPSEVARGLLGRPHLLLGEIRGPAVSFSQGGGKVWAALCGDESDIGVDVAGADEFPKGYPYHRVFHPQELQHAVRLAGGDLELASALLWSVKESVVKALGCGFHLVDPRQISVYPSAADAAGEGGGYTFPVGLSGKARGQFPIAAGRSLWVRSVLKGKMWLSIALLNRRPTGHE